MSEALNQSGDPNDPLSPIRAAYSVVDLCRGEMRELRKSRSSPSPGWLAVTILLSVCGGIASASYVVGQSAQRLDAIEDRQRFIDAKIERIAEDVAFVRGKLEGR